MSITKEREAYGLTEVERKFEHLTDFVLAMAVAGLGMVITFLEFARSVPAVLILGPAGNLRGLVCGVDGMFG